MGSYTLWPIVTKVTGQTSLEFLKPRLFEPLGIENSKWAMSPEGNSLGGYGLWLCTEDIAKFGQLYLRKGRWNGRQLIPEQWVEQATSKQVPNDQESHAKWVRTGNKATAFNSGVAPITLIAVTAPPVNSVS
jgi:CubicO group peptidase (beta-lactamase class C family)